MNAFDVLPESACGHKPRSVGRRTRTRGYDGPLKSATTFVLQRGPAHVVNLLHHGVGVSRQPELLGLQPRARASASVEQNYLGMRSPSLWGVCGLNTCTSTITITGSATYCVKRSCTSRSHCAQNKISNQPRATGLNSCGQRGSYKQVSSARVPPRFLAPCYTSPPRPPWLQNETGVQNQTKMRAGCNQSSTRRHR